MSLVSVIVPVYRVAEYLTQCVESLCLQTYPRLEIILVDDGSPDRCGEMCDALARSDRRIRVIHKENGGLSSARNAGLDLADGQFVAFVDSDDFVHRDMLRRLVEAQEHSGSDLVKCGIVRFHDGQQPITQEPSEEAPSLLESPRACLDALARMKLNPAVWNKLYRREVIGNLRFPEGKVHEDLFFTPQVCIRTQRAMLIPDQLYFYRLRSASIMTEGYGPGRLDALEAWRIQLDLFRAYRLDADPLNAFLERTLANIEWNYRMLRAHPQLDPDGLKRSGLQREFRRYPTPKMTSLKAHAAYLLRYVYLGLLAHRRSEP